MEAITCQLRLGNAAAPQFAARVTQLGNSRFLTRKIIFDVIAELEKWPEYKNQ